MSTRRPRPLVRAPRAWHGGTVSNAITNGVRVTVSTEYVPSHSDPTQHRYLFAYKVRIANEGARTVQLRSRHWIITDATGKVEEVRGPGVVGKQPVIKPGEHFEYTSSCMLETPRGSMRGDYQMTAAEGDPFDAEIATFQLSMPHSLN
jgi:ApaG protein